MNLYYNSKLYSDLPEEVQQKVIDVKTDNIFIDKSKVLFINDSSKYQMIREAIQNSNNKENELKFDNIKAEECIISFNKLKVSVFLIEDAICFQCHYYDENDKDDKEFIKFYNEFLVPLAYSNQITDFYKKK